MHPFKTEPVFWYAWICLTGEMTLNSVAEKWSLFADEIISEKKLFWCLKCCPLLDNSWAVLVLLATSWFCWPTPCNYLSLIVLLKKLQVIKITTWHNLAPWRTHPWFLLCPPTEIHVWPINQIRQHLSWNNCIFPNRQLQGWQLKPAWLLWAALLVSALLDFLGMSNQVHLRPVRSL